MTYFIALKVRLEYYVVFFKKELRTLTSRRRKTFGSEGL